MKLLFLSLCLFISFNAAFAQSAAVKGSEQSPGKPEDSTILTLCSNASGQPGYLVKNGKGQSEFKNLDEFEKSKAAVQSKSNLSRAVNVKATTTKADPPPAKIRETVAADRVAGKDPNTKPQSNKLPPPLTQDPSQH